uniref:SMODS and SLOG-associating 2TM effector domain-containing protein n=1 Tax=viral metagenome TaxID=1070528 RepID=A0A6C0DQD7_9ZZZZ
MASKKTTADLDEKSDSVDNNSENKDAASSTSIEKTAPGKHIKWSPENEEIMVEWCDIAQCYKWLNSRAHSRYSYMHAWFTIPAITLSTISGTASFAQTSIPAEYQTYAPMAIGTINIFIGILTTVQQYLKISELNEAHRVASISWDKFARNIRIELSKEPCERTDAGQFIKYCRQEFDRLMETSPSISKSIINEFNRSFTGDKNSDKQMYFEELKKPDICNTIISAGRYRHPWYKEEERKKLEREERERRERDYEETMRFLIDPFDKKDDAEDPEILRKRQELNEKEQDILLKEKEIAEKLEKRRTMQNAFHRNVVEAANKMRKQIKTLEDYVSVFQTMYGRVPMKDELISHANALIASGEIQQEALDKYLDKVYHKVTNSAVVI